MPIIDLPLLRTTLPALALPDAALAHMEHYAAALLETNAHMNLTAITDPRGVTLKHFADSLSLLTVHDFPQGARVLDLGTGGGFPGVPLLLARPDLRVTFLDGTGKKLRFIAQTLADMGINAETLHARAEDIHKTYRGQFDVVTARAVASLDKLCGWALPFLAHGGVLLAMKGASAGEEVREAQPVLRKLHAQVLDCVPVPLPADCGERWIVRIAMNN
ncbi:MAG: 16S rRNA (guanine(527)-N(7))-methyltransferase RsmG [Oscillospiraceae bacterium]|jgi:16S rRNA (guanine527-N7)-methyltransferase|nr:16S rRNA (guanine(527)-N(7))-methyltransferase RsmG [Oscillospiraceae bacterium]